MSAGTVILRCKLPFCDRPWNRGDLLLCDVHEEIALDEHDTYRDDPSYPHGDEEVDE